MSTFFHHPDDLIYITVPGDPAQNYMDTLTNFNTDVTSAMLTAYPGLPINATQRNYDGIRHLVRYPNGYEDDIVPWAPGDDYFTNITALISAKTTRNTPPVNYDALRSVKFQAMVSHYNSLVAVGASYDSAQYSIRQNIDVPLYEQIYSLALDPGYTWVTIKVPSTIPNYDTEAGILTLTSAVDAIDFCQVILRKSADVNVAYKKHEFLINSLPDDEEDIGDYDVTDFWPSI